MAAGTADRIGQEHGGWLVYSSEEVVRLTGLARGRRCLITCQHLQQFVGIAS